MFQVGLDVGSTTAKIVLISPEDKEIIHSEYIRHNTKIDETVLDLLENMRTIIGDNRFSLTVTGSAGYGISEKLDIPFIQEVVASSMVVKTKYPEVKTLIDIGGEDSKMIFFSKNRVPDIRMNGSCAGGTGAFIDQIASLVNVETGELNELAEQSTQIYPIASRCGVFAKTDVQNLLSRKVPLPDIAASTFQAVVVQTLNTLARGYDIKPKVIFIGGPFKFLSALKKLFIKNMKLKADDIVEIDFAEFVPAFGAALSKDDDAKHYTIDEIRTLIKESSKNLVPKNRLSALFKDKQELDDWNKRRIKTKVPKVSLADYHEKIAFLGIDSGSTTSKITILGKNGELLFKYYSNNKGNAVEVVKEGLIKFRTALLSAHGDLDIKIAHATVTGYGEDLIKAAFGLDKGVVETIAHYTAARHFNQDVSFIMDIGGQDMKAIFIENGIINRIELNESCSSGSGSFIQAFGNTLGFSVGDFASIACNAQHPADLGTRCTVFMNSKVKQSLRENAAIEDISAGLAISVIKNALYKVLKLKNVEELGDNIVVQGGTFRNPAVHRALEVLTGKEVICSDIPELMGAYGAALLSREIYSKSGSQFESAFIGLDKLDEINHYKTRQLHCKGCVNNCTITKFTFDNKNVYYSGNNCEDYFSNKGEVYEKGFNFPEFKYNLLFQRKPLEPVYLLKEKKRMGLPRVLNLYENYPFWHALLTSLDFEVVLSDESSDTLYHSGAGTIMSDNVCFPAKLAHGHIQSLIDKQVDSILYPMVFYQQKEFEDAENSYNCPIVSGYADVIHNSMEIEDKYGINFHRPVINFNDTKLLQKACYAFLKDYGISRKDFQKAFQKALEAQEVFKSTIKQKGQELVEKALDNPEQILVVLAGRPYHVDPLINHKIPNILTDLGIDIVTEDALPVEAEQLKDLQVITQWIYPNRIYNAAKWVARQADNIQFIQFNSFGCGPDAIVIDEVAEILKTAGKIHTVLKIDDISSIGSVKLRLRSLLESLRIREKLTNQPEYKRKNTPDFLDVDKNRTILIPHFSEFYSPFLPALFSNLGYHFVNLPSPDKHSVAYGLKYSNNEICYPATVIVGDIIKALESGKYDRKKIAVGISQTGGQCRATSYLSLIKKGMIAAGYDDIPVISVGTSGKTINSQPGFKVDWKKMIPVTFTAIVFADMMANMFYATVVRERKKGTAQRLVDAYYKRLEPLVAQRKTDKILDLLAEAVQDFNQIEVEDKVYPKIGIVGEIYIKYNSFGNNHVVKWLIDQGIEVVVPPLIDFFLQDFVNFKVNNEKKLQKPGILSQFLVKFLNQYANHKITKVNRIMSQFRYYRPYHNMEDLAKKAEKIVSLANQFGEGWLIPAEISDFAESGVSQVVSLQPFGCIANHIISKGIEKRVKKIYPDMSLLFLDFDNDISEVNIINRLHFLIDGAREKLQSEQLKTCKQDSRKKNKKKCKKT